MNEDRGVVVVGAAGRRQGLRSGVFGVDRWDDGLLVFDRDKRTGLLSGPRQRVPLDATWALGASPSGDCVYAVTESTDGGSCSVVSCVIDVGSTIRVAGVSESGGTGACHVASTANHVFVSHFVAGGFAAFSTNRFGVVQNLQSVFTPTGCGPHPRQDRPHPHQVIPLPDGRLVGVDLGGDVVRHLSLDPSNGLRQSGSSALQPGAGPRNAVVLNNGDLVVANEIDNTLTYLAHDADVGGWSSLGFTSTLFESGSGLESSVGAIAASGDGRFVYVGNRGADTVAVFQVDWTRSFPLVPLMEGPVGGHRSHTMIIVDGYLYAANTRSNSLTVIPVDSETGRVLDVVQTLPIPGPMALVAL